MKYGRHGPEDSSLTLNEGLLGTLGLWMRSQKTPFRVLLVNLEISHYIQLIYKKVKQLDSAKAGKDLKRKFLVKIRAVAKPCGPKWGAKRDQTLSYWFTNCILLIFNQGKTIWVPAKGLKEKKTWFCDFESTLIRKTVILQRKKSSNWKIQEKGTPPNF